MIGLCRPWSTHLRSYLGGDSSPPQGPSSGPTPAPQGVLVWGDGRRSPTPPRGGTAACPSRVQALGGGANFGNSVRAWID